MHLFRKAVSAVTTSPAQLLLNGYRLNSDGHIIGQRDGARRLYDQIGAISIDTRDCELVDRLVQALDEPRALVGRDSSRNVILFRVEGERSVKPDILNVAAPYRTGVFKLARNGEPVTISCLSAAAVVHANAYAWGERSPYTVPRELLPILDETLSTVVVNEAFELGCSWAPSPEEIEREARVEQFHKDVAAGRAKVPTLEEIYAQDEARKDAETVAAWADREVFTSDGNHASLVLAARYRHAERQRKKQSDAAA